MKKILFTAIYPFWFFLAKTWLGGMLMICLMPMIPAFLIIIIFPDLMNTAGEEAESVGVGVGIFSLLCSPFVAIPLIIAGVFLENHYEQWNYKTEMETKMI